MKLLNTLTIGLIIIAASTIDTWVGWIINATPAWIVTTVGIAALLALPIATVKALAWIWKEARNAR